MRDSTQAPSCASKFLRGGRGGRPHHMTHSTTDCLVSARFNLWTTKHPEQKPNNRSFVGHDIEKPAAGIESGSRLGFRVLFRFPLEFGFGFGLSKAVFFGEGRWFGFRFSPGSGLAKTIFFLGRWNSASSSGSAWARFVAAKLAVPKSRAKRARRNTKAKTSQAVGGSSGLGQKSKKLDSHFM